MISSSTPVAHTGRARLSGRRLACWSLALAAPASLLVAVPAHATVPTTPVYTASIVAGTGVRAAATPGDATASAMKSATSVATDAAGNLYIADSSGSQILKVTPSGTLSVLAGTGTYGDPVEGPATSSPLGLPQSVAADAAGNVYVADAGEDRIVKIDTAGTLSYVAGSGVRGSATPNVTATTSPLRGPNGVAVDDNGDVYIADTGNEVVEKVSATDGKITVVAGVMNTAGPSTEGPATSSNLSRPLSVAVDDGDVYIGDGLNHYVQRVNSAGNLSHFAGDGTTGPLPSGSADATSTPVGYPSAISVDDDGNVFVVDGTNKVLQRINRADVASVVAGNGTSDNPVAGPALSSPFKFIYGVAAGANGQVFVGDNSASQVVRLDEVVPVAPEITSAAPAPATVGTAYSHQFTATGTPAPTWSYTGTLPAGLTLDPQTGVLSGTPTSAGSTDFTVEATNQVDVDPQLVHISVASSYVPTPVTPTPTTTTPASPVTAPSAGTHRYAGGDRVSTATTVSRQLFARQGSATSAVVTTSSDFADALGGARLASAVGAPLLLSSPTALDTAVGTELTRVLTPGATVYLLGGGGAVSPAVEDAITALPGGYRVVRLAGDDRYQTAVDIADAVASAGNGTGPIYLVDGTNHPDGLAAAALAARTGGTVVLSAGATLPAGTLAYLTEQDPTGARTTPVGGKAAAAAAALPATAATRAAENAIVGADRYETARLVAAQFADGGAEVTTVGLARGDDWPDALTAAAAMGNLGGPLLLTSAKQLNASTSQAVGGLAARHSVRTGLVFGGTDAVSDDAASAFVSKLSLEG